MVSPAELLEQLAERSYAALRLLVFGQVHEHADATHPLLLLGVDGKRPCCRRSNKRNKLPALHVPP